jgi:VWFA-related protein
MELPVTFFVLAMSYGVAQPGNNVTFTAGVHLVVVPVVVRDPKGQAVGNLTKDDFQLFDKGKRQHMTKFTVEKAGGQVANSAEGGHGHKATEPSGVAPDTFIAYLFDDVHLNFADLARVRDGADRNIDASQPTDRMAIFTTSAQGMLGFTCDRAKLHAALLKLRPHPLAGSGKEDCPDVSYYVADLIQNQGDQAALEAVTAETMDCMRLRPRAIDMARGVARDEARRALQRGLEESRTSLLLLKDAVRRISTMPGRRIVILASPGFLVQEDLHEDELDVVDRATRASVIISSLDARGLYTISPGGGLDEESGAGLAQYQKADAVVLAEMAAGTGGTLIQNTNDFDGGFRRLVTPPEYIYTLGFEPEDLKPDGSFHALKV